jgi:hypothetical protein
MSLTHCYISINRSLHKRKISGQAYLQSKVFHAVISLDGHFLTPGMCLRRSCKPANGFTICLADDNVGLVISAELGWHELNENLGYRQRNRTPNSSASPLILARNSSSSVGTGVTSGGNSDPGSRTESAPTRVKEDSNDSVEPRDFCTSSKLEAEHSNVDPPAKEANVSEDSAGLVEVSPSVILRVLFEEAPSLAPIA